MAGRGGSRKLDVGVLSAEQREKLRQHKSRTRLDNERYLEAHPEVQLLIGGFLRRVLLKKPDDIHEFAADHFTNSNLHATLGSKPEENKDLE